MSALHPAPGARARWRAAVALLMISCGLRAQEASYGPIEWQDPADAPDELPALKSRPSLEFPRGMEKTPDIGYVVYDLILDEKGQVLSQKPHATTTALEHAPDDRFRFTPARREGKGVVSAVNLSLLFNPASALSQGPDATPRLLDVSVARVRVKAPAALPLPDQVVDVTVTVNAEGRVAGLDGAPPEFARQLEIAAKNWRFAPARKAGRPVSATVRVPFIIDRSQEDPGRGSYIPPRVIARDEPVYPFVMRASGMRGEVVVGFVVDIEGRTRNVYVVRSLNEAFDDSALEAVRHWKFEPARHDGIPVNTRMRVPILFQLRTLGDGGEDGLQRVHRGDVSKLPPEFQYDTEPKLRGSARPVYPYAELAAKTEGRAVVTFMIDERGRVVGTKVLSATTPSFGASLVAALERFEFEPALKHGRPSRAMLSFQQDFNRGWQSDLVSVADLDVLRREQKKPDTIAGLRELDHKLKPISQKPPIFPTALKEKFSDGEAVIEFLVDEDGRARLPRIVSSTDPAFGYAAVQAVARWQFEPPTRGGRSVVVRVQVPVKFLLQADPAPVPSAAAAESK